MAITGIARVRKFPAPRAFKLALLVCCGISANALAARNPVIVCDKITQDMHSAGNPVDSLKLKIVDHSPVVAATDLNQPLELADAELQVVAPVLSLTPRVATLLDRIFATDDRQFNSSRAQSSSLLAERITDPAALQDTDEVTIPRIQQTTADENSELPRIPQQMFRKDI